MTSFDAKEIDETKMLLYRQSARQRAAQKNERLQARYELAISIAEQAAKILKQEFQAQKVVLFGSMVAWQNTHLNSDIDLAVWGMPEDSIYKAVARLISLDNRIKIDLVLAKTVDPNLLAAIEGAHVEL
ncbi:MAG: nucleotidyltransferase domain-containing protein [Cyanobacteria bacterium J06636_28]